ncbi:VOC family protein [Nocardioides sp. LS1]|uniref:VOC family protein n=1 Tax=Nocardioides sp. LS1 TaxID=1027620 RepID=UPI000F61E764|nr:VOC family protein [Nocardioides sp. LS1]GCD89346.1 hypothetical protein NLS1_13520 [Nocardioides sp. LS1]
MSAREVQITFDAHDPGAQAEFWAVALHYVLQPPPDGFDTWDAALDAWGVPPEARNDRSAIVDPDGARPRVFFQKVPEGKVAKNKLHLDVRAAAGVPPEGRMAALEEACGQLLALGASRLQRFEPGEELGSGFIVMQDPEGNEFCLD